MDQVIAKIGEYPLRIVVAFDADRMLAALCQLQADLFADGLNLLRIGAGTDQEEIGERGYVPEVEDSDVNRFLRFGGADCGKPRRSAKR